MLRIRVKKLISCLESIESETPGLVLNVLKNKELELYMSDFIRKKESEKINQIINALFELTNNSEQELINLVCDKFSGSTEQLISTTAYGKIIGIDAKPTLFEFLKSKGLISRALNKYQLTEEGMKYGDYLYTENNEKFIGWRKTELDNLTKNLRRNLVKDLDFKLYHMTHISNLKGILKDGLMSHNLVRTYVDISNNDVNKRRSRTDNPHKINLHQYVPLYFNPRNAMLFSCQKQFGEDIVILEIDNEEISNDYTLFSEGNAARQDSKITTNKLDLANFKWEAINSSAWSDNYSGVDINLKSLMMSECLILNSLNSQHILRIFCSNENVRARLFQQSLTNVDIEVDKSLFF
ncbi:MAG: hypothetical protein ACJAUK_001040 [Colwellia polaris]|jgi:hypothetical protein